MLKSYALVLALAASTLGCADIHMRSEHGPSAHVRGTREARHVGRSPQASSSAEAPVKGRKQYDWSYLGSPDWAYIKPEYAQCQKGSMQSPINLQTRLGSATTHKPTFNYKSAPGDFFNWGYGPAMNYYHPENSFTSLPSFSFDRETAYLIGWHVHFPSEHLIDGQRSRAELHLVHVTAEGKERAVVGIPIDVSLTASPSPFLTQLARQRSIGVNDTSVVENVSMDPGVAIREVDSLSQYWTYKGSLTTPPCSEGLRWFVSMRTIKATTAQLQALLSISRFSNRVEQFIWEHQVNV